MKKPVVLITGASQGIGAAIAKVFAREIRGLRLALVARNAGKLARVAAQVERAKDVEEEVRKRLRPLALQATAAERAEVYRGFADDEGRAA